MTSRLLVVAHGRLVAAGDPPFGDPGPLVGDATPPVIGRVQAWAVGPEQACRQTADQLELPGGIEPDLGGPDMGRWTGRRLGEIAAKDPEGLQRWLADPTAAPHGGESLAAAQDRIGAFCDGRSWPRGRSVLILSPVAARLLAVHALGGPPEQGLRLDVAPGGRFELSGGGGSWRLRLG